MPLPRTANDTKPDLRLVGAESEVYDLMRPAATPSERVRRLQAEARALALEQVEALDAALARDIADGGDAYPVGARDMAARLADDLPKRADSLRAVVNRTK
ncbi:hypothetical protein [uncultured Brevundimonas sp.]|uniref:hypothetical protein n=1 Tax=uncultured Brevundimonas sp. TaxID=213418 RepID=UPI0030ECAE03|tara:strand:+ start:133 stop:435 length:303 start_codon:yes stop_codon:yes gene_type:complete